MSDVSFATTQDQRIDELRRSGVRRALHHLRAGHPRAAREFMLFSVEKQARIAGIGFVQLPRRDDIAS